MFSLTRPSYDVIRRKRNGAKFNSTAGLFIDEVSLNGIIDNGESWGGTARGPGIVCELAPGSLANEAACATEYYNQNPWSDVAGTNQVSATMGDGMFSGRVYVSSLVEMTATGAALAYGANAEVGIGMGSPWEGLSLLSGGAPTAENDLHCHFSMRLNLFTGVVRLVMIDQWNATAGLRRTSKTLGTLAAIGLNPGLMASIGTASPQGFESVGMHWEIVFLPAIGFDCFINGVLVGTFRDSDGVSGTAPVASWFTKRAAAGMDIKGVCAFVTNGAAANPRGARARFVDFYREIEAHF